MSYDFAQTSLTNFYDLVKVDLAERQKDVYDVILEKQPCTSQQVADHLNTKLNCVSGRFTELHNIGLIKPCGVTKHGKSSFRIWRCK